MPPAYVFTVESPVRKTNPLAGFHLQKGGEGAVSMKHEVHKGSDLNMLQTSDSQTLTQVKVREKGEEERQRGKKRQ